MLTHQHERTSSQNLLPELYCKQAYDVKMSKAKQIPKLHASQNFKPSGNVSYIPESMLPIYYIYAY